MNHTKICTSCQEEFPATVEYFFKKVSGKYGITAKCKNCMKQYNNKLYQEYRPKILEQKRVKNIKESDKMRVRRREQYIKHKDQRLVDAKRYREKNKEKIKKRVSKYTIKRYHSDINFKLKMNLSRRMRQFISKQGHTTIELIGCSINTFKNHIESLFTDGMSWENYGRNGWHIDHILPCASFDLTDLEQRKKCFHYTNLQPLWEIDNIRKSDKVPYNQQ